MIILAGCKLSLGAGYNVGKCRVGNFTRSGVHTAPDRQGGDDLRDDSRYRQRTQNKDGGGGKGRTDQSRCEQARPVQAAPEQGTCYGENQQRAPQRVRQQYPDIGHACPFVKVGQRRPHIGFLLLDMRFRVSSPVFRCQARIGRHQHDAPVFRLGDLSASPRDGTGRFFLNARPRMEQIEFIA